MEIQSPKNHGVEKKRKEKKNVKWHLPGDEEQARGAVAARLSVPVLQNKQTQAKRLENGNGSQTLPLHSQRCVGLLGRTPRSPALLPVIKSKKVAKSTIMAPDCQKRTKLEKLILIFNCCRCCCGRCGNKEI